MSDLVERLRKDAARLVAPVMYRACAKHEGQSWSMEATATVAARSVCPLCDAAMEKKP